MNVAIETASLPGERPDLAKVPEHVAIIMDGNGRWAQMRGLPRLAGHRAGTENIRNVLEGCVEFGVKTLTIYAFSTENWGRPRQEVRGLMSILGRVIRRDTKRLHENGVRLRHIGRLDDLPQKLREAIIRALDLTKSNTAITLNVAFNYGGRREILDAVRGMIADRVAPERVDEGMLSSYLYTSGQPDPDLIIRTAGEMRLSNFLIWQSAYAEYYTTPVFWPDFTKDELRKALLAYGQRERRFGKVLT
ncbi:MAG: isoprenyl transferase [Chloroflexi bacterium]|nr:isoprenyl transferase [Chloroflexota bacterium]